MELDPRLRSANGDGSVDHGPSSTSKPSSGSPAVSPSAQLLNSQSHSHSYPQPPGADTPDPPSSSLGANQPQQLHDGDDAKRPRACEACRGLKVRCEPDPNDDGPCKRCKKAGRNCVVTVPTRKRQKKTDSRVAELEKKIDALTASLQSRAAPAAGGVSAASTSPAVAHRGVVDEPGALNIAWRNLSGSSWSPSQGTAHTPSTIDHGHRERATSASHNVSTPAAGTKRKFSDGRDAEDQQQQSAQQQYAEAQSLDTMSIFARIAQGDIIERGLLTMERATELFARYNDHMVLHLPAVVFPPKTTIADLRKSKPILFHAVMAAASSESPVLQKVLQKELMTMFAEKIIITGEKTVEIIQALHVAVIWYWPPEHFEELKFYQLVHIAAVMGIDVGLGQKLPLRNKGKFVADTFRQNPFRRSQPPDPTTIESRRTWLTCYFLAANTSMALHRPNLVRWNPFMSECVQILENSPDAAPTDKYFCHLVWTHRLAEEVGMQFSLDDPSCPVNITDARTQYALKGLERDLDKYSASVSPDLLQPTLKISFHVVNLYMHEMALHSRSVNNAHPANFGPDSLRDGLVNQDALSAAHISALSACLNAINGMLSTFLSMDVFSVRCLPVFNFVRVSYALVILIKLFFSATSPDSELGKVINKEDMRVEYYLDALLDKFRATAAEDRSRPAAKFLVVLVMLRSWFYKQTKGDKNDQQPPTPANHAVSQPPHMGDDRLQPTANTPLQLLSEVAAGSSTANTGPNTSAPTGNTSAEAPTPRPFTGWPMRQPPQPFFHDSGPGSSTNTPTPGTGTGGMPPPPLDMPSDLVAAMAPGIPMMANDQGGFSSDLDYGLNAGFDLEAMGLGLGSQDMYENGMRIAMNEPWFSDMFQTMPGGSMFNV